MARDICKVIDFLIEVIPQTEHHVVSGMRHIQRKATYTPPEGWANRWYELAVFLHDELGTEHTREWTKRVARIMRDEEKVPNSQLPERKDNDESQ